MKKLLLCASVWAFGASTSHAVMFENKTDKEVTIQIKVGDLTFNSQPIQIGPKLSHNVPLADNIAKEINKRKKAAAITIHTFIGKKTQGCDVFLHLYDQKTEKFIESTDFDNKTIKINKEEECSIS